MLAASTTMEDKIDNCVINAKHSINANGKIGYTEFIIKGLGL